MSERAQTYLARALILALAVAAMLPLRHDFPPITDFPEHAATVATLVDLSNRGPLSEWYELDYVHTQYWLMAVTAAKLTALVNDPALALVLLLAAASIGLVAALLRFARRHGLDERLVVVAIPLLWSRPFSLGFIPFLLASPLVVLALTDISAPQRPSLRQHARIAAFGLAVFFLNLASAVWLLGAAVLIALVLDGRHALRRAAGALTLIIPMGAWVALSSVTNVDVSRYSVSMTPRWWSPKHILLEAPQWLTDRWSGDLDLVVLALVLLGVVACLIPTGERDTSSRRVALTVFLATFALVFALPFERGWLWGLSMRFLPMAVTVAPLALSARRGVFRHVAVVLFAIASVLSIIDAERHTQLAQVELSGISLLRGLPAGSRLLQLSFDDGSSVANDALASHAGAYHRVWNRGPNEPSFVDLPQSVLRYREGKEPWTRPWPWEFAPNEYDNLREGHQYDFVLTRGTGPSFPPSVAGPAFELLREDGAFRLYRRVP